MKEDSFNGIMITLVVLGLSLGLTYYIPTWQAQDHPNLIKQNVSIMHVSTNTEILDQLNAHLPVPIIQNGVKGNCLGFSIFKNNSTVYCSRFYDITKVTIIDVTNARTCYIWDHGNKGFCQ